MITNKTVIISCAGMGSRLGAGIPKALVEIDGKSLIVRTLELLKNVRDVRVVVGYQSEKVIEAVKKFRSDVIFVYNRDYMNNGTAASVSLALDGAQEYFLTIDGDLIVHPEDMEKMLNTEGEFICGTKVDSENPVKMSINESNMVVSFSRELGEYEWTGVTCLKTSGVQKGERHVYQMIEPLLPKQFMYIRTKEVLKPLHYSPSKVSQNMIPNTGKVSNFLGKETLR